MATSGLLPSGSIGRTWLQTVTSTAAVTLCSFLTSVLTARVLGPQGRGLMAAALLVATLASGIAQLGLANALVYHCGTGKPLHARFLTGMSLALILLLTLPLVLIGLHQLYPASYERNTWLLLLLGIASAWFSFASTTAQTRADLKIYNATRTVQPLLSAAFLLGALATGVGLHYTDILLFQAAVMLFLAVYTLHRIWHQLPAAPELPTRWTDMRAMGNYALKYHGTILLSLLLLNIDKIFLLGRVDAAQFGFYALAFATTRILSSIQDAAAVTTFARFAGRSGQDLAAAVATSFRLSFLPMLIVAALMAASAPLLIPLVFGKAFAAMAAPFMLLCFEAVLGAASWTLAQRFNADGRPGLILLRQGLVVMPLLAILPFLPTRDTVLYLAALMLGAALLRLLITLAMIPMILKEPLPPLLPRWQECQDIVSRLRPGSCKN